MTKICGVFRHSCFNRLLQCTRSGRHVRLDRRPQCFIHNIFRLDLGAKQFRCHFRHGAATVIALSFCRHRCAGTNVNEMGIARSFPQAAKQHRDIGPLPSPVGMEFIEHQKFKVSCRLRVKCRSAGRRSMYSSIT